MAGLVKILDINPPSDETEKAVLTVMMASLGNPYFDPNKAASAQSEEKRTHLSNLCNKLTAKAHRITEVKKELELVKEPTGKWYRTINDRVCRKSRNPWRLRSDNTASHIIQVRKSWKNTWSNMGLIEKRVMVQCNLKSPEFQRLLLDDEALTAFEADMKRFREMQMELSREYLKVVEIEREG